MLPSALALRKVQDSDNTRPIAAPDVTTPRNYNGPPHPHNTRRDGRPTRAGQFRPVPHSPVLPFPSQRGRNLLMFLRYILPSTTTSEIFATFSRYGTIVYIELDDPNKYYTRMARLRFEPFPEDLSFFRQGQAMLRTGGRDIWVWVEFSTQSGYGNVKTPLGNACPRYVNLPICALTFGVLGGPESVIAKKTLGNVSNDRTLLFSVDFDRKKIVLNFAVPHGEMTGQKQMASVSTAFKAEIKFSHIRRLYRVSVDSDGKFGFVITVKDPPIFSRKRAFTDRTFREDRLVWGDHQMYQRVVDIKRGLGIAEHPVSLDDNYQIIDIGRWTTYWLELDQKEYEALSMVGLALHDWNIKTADCGSFSLVPNREPDLWPLLKESSEGPGSWSQYLVSMESQLPQLPFDVRYQLEVCISHGVLSEYSISREFLVKLHELSEVKVMGSNRARLVLEFAADQWQLEGRQIFDPMLLFENKGAMTYLPAVHLPAHCTLMRKVIVTPTMIYFNTPTIETTNRIIRRYKNIQDHFIRVQFTDELLEGSIQGCDGERNDLLYRRVYRVLGAGIQMGTVRWSFLAFGNSQIREHGALFVNDAALGEGTITSNVIRQWMGNFQHITVVAKYAARLGQCLSTTRPASISAPRIVKIFDVETPGYCFTDGVGKISPFLVHMIAEDWKMFPPPSAIQFRMGGCKGVLVAWPNIKGAEVHVRKSQEKFSAEFNGLEIIRCSQFASATLNRQTITVLSSLGVPDQAFIDILTEQISRFNAAMECPTKAADLLSRYVDENQTTLMIKDMVVNGFMSSREPFVNTLLQLYRSWSIKTLKEKARLVIEESAFVLGCVDETDSLRGHKKATEGLKTMEVSDLPQIFLQIPDPDSPTKTRIVTGVCIVGRNPSLHPGDIRVVEAVDVPELRHLMNVVVFPLSGDRDVPGMCSGGDLDGDDFFVIWDKRLIPTIWNHPPMDYTPAPAREESGGVTVESLKAFFVLHMKNNNLPLIAHAHLATADSEPAGPMSRKCLQLTQLHSIAVDYVKTGNPAEWDRSMDPKKWPHFMEKKASSSYHSTSVLGQLYDRVKRQVFDVREGYKLPFDERIIKRFAPDNDLLKKARVLKSQYDIAMRRVMAQLEVGTEFEIWTSFVMSRPRVGSSYKIQEKVGHESHALKKQFRDACVKEVGSRDSEALGPFVAAMYQVTWEEVKIALHESRQPHVLPSGKIRARLVNSRSMPLISFPWLFAEVLGELAGGAAARGNAARRGVHLHAHVAQEMPVEQEEISLSYTLTSDGQVVHRGEVLNLFQDDESDVDDEDQEDPEPGSGATETPSSSDSPEAEGMSSSAATADTTSPSSYSASEMNFEEDVLEIPAESVLEKAVRLGLVAEEMMADF